MKAKTISCRSHLRQDPLGVWLAGLSRAVLLSGGLLVTSQAAAVDLVGADAPVGVVIASDDPHLDSVLVEKRQGEPLAEEEAPELEPISQLSEFEPELADPADAPLPPIEAEQTSLEQDADIAPAKAEGRVAFRYTDNPNGSDRDIAGILSSNRRVLGMMPHPERACDPAQGNEDGARLFAHLTAALAEA